MIRAVVVPKEEVPQEGASLFLCASPAMEQVKAIVERVADTDITVLIRGEIGTGKGLVAQTLHDLSSRREGPFITVNCAAIPGELLESELFGYKAGTVAEARSSYPSRFEQARGGTLFLDDIGEVELSWQTRLLELLQNRRLSPVEGREVRADARVIASTHRDLEEVVAYRKFRNGRYYRLDVVSLFLPPLRERPEEIPVLVEHFSRRYSQLYQRRCPCFSARTLKLFQEYPWPGNVRELENAMKLAVILENEEAVAQEISARKDRNSRIWLTLPPANRPRSRNGRVSMPLKEIARKAAEAAEREAILEALDLTGWNRREAARYLGISYKAFLYKMKSCDVKEGPW
ncbi:MAG: sigma-54-dependent Fis family transcriptional regulator [Candidatus Tectomicrobia bacterium]|uniref:Sigma-54-dependent Fis family transcriptional regulator n=1 Tax=Tectimicrobiota bacterium TaxID=2528274 RepID=A0A932FZX6_UNCTE|nr:sigma-54-dependent Fis family transcriptional regulator [Candidatus Tectomicrobia bacterium]